MHIFLYQYLIADDYDIKLGYKTEPAIIPLCKI